VVSGLSGLLSGVGRLRESMQALGEAWKIGPPNPSLASTRVLMLWATGRLEEAEAALGDAAELYPTHFAIWFRRFFLLLYTGRPAEALAFGQNVETRPSGIPDWNFDLTNAVARAMISRAPADIDKALASNVAASHRGAGFASNTIQFASVLGRIDTAFAVGDAYFFGRGFETGELDFSAEQRSYTRRDARPTGMLFMPSTAAMRADPRFDRLVGELGLERYWARSGSRPDYRRYG
jgi:tetratricopeptide (TPR) repeat protein